MLDWIFDHFVAVCIAAVVVVVGIVAVCLPSYAAIHTAVCHVVKTDRTSKSDGGSDARVYTDNCGTFQVSDSIIHPHFRSGDVFGSILANHTYTFEYYGWRNGLFSMFPNILSATEVK